MKKLTGIIPPLVTPVDCNGELDVASLKKLIDNCIDGRMRRYFYSGFLW